MGKPRQTEQVGEILVGLLLPAAAPHRIEPRAEGLKVARRAGRKEVRDAVDLVPRAVARPFVHAEAPQRQHAIDVNEQQRVFS